MCLKVGKSGFKWHNLLWLTITALLLVALLVGRIVLPWKTLVSKIGFKKPEARWIMISIFGGAGAWLAAVFLQGFIVSVFPYPKEYVEAACHLNFCT